MKVTKRNPKQKGSNLWDCKPQVGECPLKCNQCFYNRPGAFYVSIHRPHMPTVDEVGDGIMRVNCGHDSNYRRVFVIKQTERYKNRFFNTSLPKFKFPGPVVYTANPKEERQPKLLKIIPNNLMFIRLRVSTTNLHHIYNAVMHYTNLDVPVVLTFMAYYHPEPKNIENYVWRKRHINSYWCPIPKFKAGVLEEMKRVGGRLVTMCGILESPWCKDCRNCETYYWQTIKHMARRV